MRIPINPRLPQTPGDEALKRQLNSLWADLATQLNGLSEGAIVAATNAATAAPTTGTWKQGDFVRNSTPTELGAAASKYVILGWIRLTSGTANVLNTDWVACRALTGN